MSWYSQPGNAERRKRRMRSYGKALVLLGRRYPADRKARYRQAIADGLLPTKAQNRAGKELREAHPAEFREIYEALLAQPPEGGDALCLTAP